MASPDLLQKLAIYVPGPVAKAIYHRPQPLTKPTSRHLSAAILFSDISGFTPLSELLNQAGPNGVESLTFLINRYFTQMIQIVHNHQGQVVKFSGDAITVLFPAEDVPMQMAVHQAGACALAMQKEMQNFSVIETPQGNVSLSMKVGIGAGKILEANIGGVLGRWEYVVGGDPLVQVSLAEHKAQPSQTILSPQAWAEVQTLFEATSLDDGFVKLEHPFQQINLEKIPDLDWSQLSWEKRQLAEAALQCYIPGAIKARLDKQSEWLAELRRMTILFIGIGGLDYKAPNAGEQLQNFIQATQELLYRYEGSLGKVAVDDKGTVVLILFGAPPFSHEDDAQRAVAFALSLQIVAREQNLRVSIGITEDQIFAGPIGAPTRREYTVIGDQVNLAARLMQYGRAGTILVTQRIKERAGHHFILDDLGQVSLKGKQKSVPAYQVKGEQDSQDEFITRYLSYEDPIIGRDQELSQIAEVTSAVLNRKFQLLFIEGELGLGKSRLTAELVRQWIQKGQVGYGSKCISYGRQIPYQAWREILSAIFGLDPTLDSGRKLARLASRVAELPDPPDQPNYWADRLPLLADVMGFDAPENKFTQGIPGDLRRDNTFALIEAVLRHQVERGPLLILLEDIHWADELSIALATYLGQKLLDCPLFLVLVHRPLNEAYAQVIQPLHNLPFTQALRLTALSETDSQALIKLLLADKSLPAEAMSILLERGQGNPFFLQEITGVLLSLVENQSEQQFRLPETLDLPDTVQDVILSRIDRLSEAEKLTLKIASVIGAKFQRILLSKVHPVTSARFLLPSQLEKLEMEKLLRLEAPAPKWEYVFHNVITQEVVYEGLLLAQRRQLHTTVGTVLEELLPDEIEGLAFHFGRSNDLNKAVHYLTAAAQKASREYAIRAAVGYYSELLSFITERATTEKDISIISPEYWQALLDRVKLYNLLGQREHEGEDLGTLGVIAEALNDNQARALAARQWARFYETAGDYSSGLEMIERSAKLAEEAGDEILAGAAYNQWGKLLYLTGEYNDAYGHLQRALQIANMYNDKNAEAEALNSLGVVAHYQTDYEVALYFFEEAQTLREEVGEQIGYGRGLRNIGQVYYDTGYPVKAYSYFEQAMTLHQKIGDRVGEAITQHNMGGIHISLGDYTRARHLLETALTSFQAMEDPRREAHTLTQLGHLHYRLNDYVTAKMFLEEAKIILEEIGDPWAEGVLLSYYGLVLTAQKDLEQAENIFRRAMKLEQKLGQDAAEMEDAAYLAQVDFEANKIEQAYNRIQQVAAFIDEHGIAGMENPILVYWICFKILKQNNRLEEADAALNQAKSLIDNQANEIEDCETRKNYLNIAEHKNVKQL